MVASYPHHKIYIWCIIYSRQYCEVIKYFIIKFFIKKEKLFLIRKLSTSQDLDNYAARVAESKGADGTFSFEDAVMMVDDFWPFDRLYLKIYNGEVEISPFH